MIVEIGGGEGGFKEYLETGQKKGRELHRNQLDQRIPLFGNLDVFEMATSTHEGEGQRYDHITLSFSENHVTDEMLQVVVNEFRDHALSAWPERERDRIAFYAEAHRPRTLSYINAETGEQVKRFVHIHIGMGRRDLMNGKSIEPLGFLGPGSANLKYIDAFQESFNSRYGFASPKDNPRITPENAVDTLARYNGSRPDAHGTFNQRKAALEVTLQKDILARNITTWRDFASLLREHGAVSLMHEGQFNECFRVKPHGADKAVRLSGIFFQRGFIERPTAEKLSVIQEKARVAYLEQMQPRKASDYVAKTLNEWNTLKAREHRYIHTGSPFYRDVYKPADAATRRQLLDQLERKSYAKSSPVPNHGKETAATRNCVPGVPARNLDGIQRRSQMLLRGDDGVDVRASPEEGRDRLGVRQADGVRDSADGDGTGNEHAGQSGRGLDVSGQDQGRGTERSIHVAQPSSVVDRYLAELRDHYEQATDKERYTEIRKNLDCHQLLNSLSHTHGLDPDLYQVNSAKDGTPRIQCGSRALTPSDFLTKEMGLPWKDAALILRRVYEQQIKREITRPRGKGASTQLWKAFKAEQISVKEEVTKRLKKFDETAKARRAALAERLKAEQRAALSGLSGDARKVAHSLAKHHAATAKAELNATLKEGRRELHESIQPRNAWQLYLQKRAQDGSEEALLTLRKLDDSARVAQPIQGVVGTIVLDNEEEKKRIRLVREASARFLKLLAHTVERNGDITYRQNGHVVLRDEGRHLAVLDEHSHEAIAAALLIAREKFGPQLTLTGSAEFQQRAVAVAVAQGIIVKFTDPKLEALRLRLIEEKRHPARAPAQPSPKPIPQVEPPVVEPSAVAVPTVAEVPAHVEVDAPALTCAEWIAQQPKERLEPRKSGDGAVEFVVAYVSDFVILDHGRTVALYPLPNCELRPGQRVVINKEGSLLPAPDRLEQEKDKDPKGMGGQDR